MNNSILKCVKSFWSKQTYLIVNHYLIIKTEIKYNIIKQDKLIIWTRQTGRWIFKQIQYQKAWYSLLLEEIAIKKHSNGAIEPGADYGWKIGLYAGL